MATLLTWAAVSLNKESCLVRKQEAHGPHRLNEQQGRMIEELEIIYFFCNLNLLEKKNNKQEKFDDISIISNTCTEDSNDSKQILPLHKFSLFFTILLLSPLFMKSKVLHWREINPQNQRRLCSKFSPSFEFPIPKDVLCQVWLKLA